MVYNPFLNPCAAPEAERLKVLEFEVSQFNRWVKIERDYKLEIREGRPENPEFWTLIQQSKNAKFAVAKALAETLGVSFPSSPDIPAAPGRV